MKRLTFHILPFLILFSISLQHFSYLVKFNEEIPFIAVSDSADEKNSEGKETEKLDKEKDDKFVSALILTISRQNLLDLEYNQELFPSDHIVEVVSPPPEVA